MLLAPFDPVPSAVLAFEQLARLEKLDPKIQEAKSLVEEHFSHVDERTLDEYIGPLLWAWTSNMHVMPPAPLVGPAGPAWIHGPMVVIDGQLALLGTQMLLERVLDHSSIEALGNEIARWARTSTRNADQLTAVQEEFRYFRDECSKLHEERLLWLFDQAFNLGYAIGSSLAR
jgi:hypothetical protein